MIIYKLFSNCERLYILEDRKNEELVNHYMTLGKDEKALKEVDNLLSKNPKNPYYLYLRAKCLNNLRRFDEALDEIKNAFAEGYSPEFCNELMGKIYFGMYDYEKAKKSFEEVFRLNPNNAETLAAYGIMQYMLSNESKDERYVKDALKIDPNNSQVLFCAFYHYKMQNNKIEMKNILEHYLETSGDEVSKLEMIGDYEAHLRHHKKANEHYKQSFLLEPTNEAIHNKIKAIDSDFFIFGISINVLKAWLMFIGGICIIAMIIIIPIVAVINKQYGSLKAFLGIAFIVGLLIPKDNKT